MTKRIDRFEGEYDFLSNFFEAPVEFDGVMYPTNEHAFQSAKTHDNVLKLQFLTDCPTPGQAKRLGRKVPLRPDWNDVKIGVMTDIVRDKFTRHKYLMEKLLATGDAELVEGTTWHDTFWGIDLETGEGENHLGQILMKVRQQLRQRQIFLDLEHQHLMETGIPHVRRWLSINRINDVETTAQQFNMDELAGIFERLRNDSTAPSFTWDSAIREYVTKHRLTFGLIPYEINFTVTGDYTVNVKATSPENALQIAKRICNDTADFGELYDENLTVKSIAYIDEHGDKHTV